MDTIIRKRDPTDVTTMRCNSLAFQRNMAGFGEMVSVKSNLSGFLSLEESEESSTTVSWLITRKRYDPIF
jgi:hypothetical protein